jgi:hypothetical protein
MSTRLVNAYRKTPLLFPEDLRDWIAEDHLVHFIVEAIEQLGVRTFKVNETGSGSRQYPPEMMAMLLVYCYATGRMSGRAIIVSPCCCCVCLIHPLHKILNVKNIRNKKPNFIL